jgi:hypothetical protein
MPNLVRVRLTLSSQLADKLKQEACKCGLSLSKYVELCCCGPSKGCSSRDAKGGDIPMQGKLVTKEQEEAVAKAVKGLVITDLGAGSCYLAQELVKLGAAHVFAVDKEFSENKPDQPHLSFINRRFENLKPFQHWPLFISWPPNWECGLLSLIEGTDMVIYLGKNTDGMSCGTPDMWWHLSSREVLTYVPHKKNTLIIYGPDRVIRPPMGEEAAALERDVITYYEQVEDVRPKLTPERRQRVINEMFTEKEKRAGNADKASNQRDAKSITGAKGRTAEENSGKQGDDIE